MQGKSNGLWQEKQAVGLSEGPSNVATHTGFLLDYAGDWIELQLNGFPFPPLILCPPSILIAFIYQLPGLLFSAC